MSHHNLKRALNCDKSIFIQACAGAGKTFALAKRYGAILNHFAEEAAAGKSAEEIDPRRILVITFTKKAAGEMATRIYQDVSRLLSGEEIPEMAEQGINFCPTLRHSDVPAVQTFTANLKDTFSQHAISTIDSFCSGILREFAHRIDLDPQFSGMDDAQSKQLLALQLDRQLKKLAAKHSEVLDALISDISIRDIRNSIKTMYRHREILRDYFDYIESRDNRTVWQEWLQRYTPDYDHERLIQDFETLWGNAQENCKNPEDALYQILQTMHQQLKTIHTYTDPLEFRAAFLSEIIRPSALIKKNDGTFKANCPGNKGNWKDKKEEAQSWFDQLRTIVNVQALNATPGAEDKKIIPLLRSLITLYREFDLYYSEIKKKQNVLDFSDIILYTRQLLDDFPDIRRQIARRYRHVMVDEFQDTNLLRWNIIKSIFQSADCAADNIDNTEKIKLFIVGDRKQSIYRFNNADVTVMNDAETLIREQGGDILDFNDNYRSTPEFVEKGINTLFGIRKIMPGKEDEREDYEAYFEPTAVAKEKTVLLKPAIDAHWCFSTSNKDIYLPAQHAAYTVKNILTELQTAKLYPSADKPLIGVLLRKFTHIGDYLQAFRMLDIPVSIIGGRGFYQTEVCRDVHHFLSVLDNPCNDHALTGLLRSPFIALSDPEIHLLAGRERGISLFEAMTNHPELRNTRECIQSWIEKSSIMPLHELLVEIMDNDDRELGYISELTPHQRLANMDKAINIIRGMVLAGNSLRIIREYFSYHIANNTDESQAPYPEQARVRISTVHKAKGLEFPVVVLPEMNQRGSSNKDTLRYGHSQGHLEMSLSLHNQEKPGLLHNLKDIVNNEEHAEDTRIFYVAVTRAIHKVYFLGEGNKPEANTWWSRYVVPFYDLDPEKPDTWPRDIIYQHNAVDVLPDKAHEAVKNSDWIEAEQHTEPGSYRYCTPHDLMQGNATVFRQGGRGSIGLAVGSCYHICMERGWFDIATQREALSAVITSNFPEVSVQDVLADCQALLEKTRQHHLYTILSNPDIEQYHELSLSGWLRHNKEILHVNGVIDLLYCHKGQWVVVDFKTDTSTEQLDTYQRQIQSYLWMVKQVYGINAAGKLYFAALDECIDIAWDERYFDTVLDGRGYRPILPEAQVNVESLLPLLNAKKHVLFCASTYHAGQVFLGLVYKGLMRPSITITTLSKWIHRSQIRTLSDDRLRLMVQQESKSANRGYSDFLAQALRDTELKKGTLLSEFFPLQQRINLLRKTAGYQSYAEVYQDPELGFFPADTVIGFIDLPPLTPLQEDLKAIMEKNTKSFSCSLVLKTEQAKIVQFIQAFSPREEVLAVADHILSSGLPKEDILIAVSSMTKYAPHIKRIFPPLGLHARFTDTRLLMEFPLTALLLDFLRICSLRRREWTDIAPLLLHPLCRPSADLQAYDSKVRRHPEKDMPLPEAAKYFKERFPQPAADTLPAMLNDFIDYMDLATSGNEHSAAVIRFVRETLDTVISDMKVIGVPLNMVDVYQESKIRIQRGSINRSYQADGIPVVGFLDSLGLTPKRLIVMGMIEGDIPRKEQKNPYLLSNDNYSLHLNQHFMRYWRTLGDRAVFSVSVRGEDGKEQQISTFLEGIPRKTIDCKTLFSRRDTLLCYENHTLNADFPLAQRHNEILSGKPGIYSGQAGEIRKHIQTSVSAVDMLLACPMRYYYEHVLHIQPMDEDEQGYWNKAIGSIIHKVLENFGRRKGFTLPQNDAVSLLQDSIKKIFTEKQLDMADPFIRDRFRYYILNLEKGSDQNCLVQLLEWNAKKFADYKANAFEYRFGMGQETGLKRKFGDIEIEIRGIIDKIMINEDKKEVIASDYKTGSINRPAFRKYLSAQLYLYTLKCMKLYPDYTASATYEQIKNPEKGNHGVRRFSEANDHFTEATTKSDTSINITIFNKLLSKLFNDISDGRYYITDRPYRDVCEYCPHEGLCRKASRLKTARNNGTAEIIHAQGGKDE